MSEPLHTKYRPTTFDEVIGQDQVVKSLKALLASDHCPHAFYLVGPPGVGKTSVARIIARELGCTRTGLMELDAGSNGQIDNIRDLISETKTRAVGSPVRVFIIDEAHSISEKAFTALLKTIEHPPEHVYFIFCTTEITKVMETVKSRNHFYKFKPIPDALISEYLKVIAEVALPRVPQQEIIDLAAIKAKGNMRQALVNLSTVSAVDDFDEANDLLRSEEDATTTSIRQIAWLMMNGKKDWSKYQPLLTELPDDEITRAKPILLSYMAGAMMRTTKTDEATRIAFALDSVEQMQFMPSAFEAKSALILAIWRIILN